MAHPGLVTPTERLLSQVWGDDALETSNVVWVYISYLRKKLSQWGPTCASALRAIRDIHSSALKAGRDGEASTPKVRARSHAFGCRGSGIDLGGYQCVNYQSVCRMADDRIEAIVENGGSFPSVFGADEARVGRRRPPMLRGDTRGALGYLY